MAFRLSVRFLSFIDQEADRALLSSMESRTPFGRMGKPEAATAAAPVSASEDGSFVNGNKRFINGDGRNYITNS
jgi:NAD(P)-dependent dehydrogenase (short-subunit alcohol dehydrogenase family)